MYIYQFGASVLGHPPVLFDMAQLESSVGMTARAAYRTVGRMPGQWNAFGWDQAPWEQSQATLTGSISCHANRRRESGVRMAKRMVGRREWLIGYRFETCGCRICENSEGCVCGWAAEQSYPPTWYATTATLGDVSSPMQRDGLGEFGGEPFSPQLAFIIDRPWERITPDKWMFGDLQIPNANPDAWKMNVNGPWDLINARHWPMRSLSRPSPFAAWWRVPWDKLSPPSWVWETCVANWSSGGWQIGRVGDRVANYDGSWRVDKDPGLLYVANAGDWPALCRLAFTNFGWLHLIIKHEGNITCEIEVQQPVTNPQYLYVDTMSGEISTRYCPVDSDPCVALTTLATYVPEASQAQPIAAILRQNLIGCIRPGINRIEVRGFHRPGATFHWAYDLTPLFS